MDLSRKKFLNNIISHDLKINQGTFLKRLGLLLKEGYSLQEAVLFLRNIEQGETLNWLEKIIVGMKQGLPLHQSLAKCNFSSQVCTQIYLASQYGDYADKIINCGYVLLRQTEQQKEFKKIIHYPLLLLSFMGGMILLMRYALLPQIDLLMGSHMDELDWFTKFVIALIRYSPLWMVGLIAITVGSVVYFQNKFKEEGVLKKVTFLLKLPILSDFLILYWTEYYFGQWSEMLKNGCSLYEIVEIAKAKDSTPMLQEVGVVLENGLLDGQSFSEALLSLPFLQKEAIAIVRHGEEVGKIATEMQVYQIKCAEDFEYQFEKLLEKIQPLVFIFIAVLIISIYAALMLPTFKLMEVL